MFQSATRGLMFSLLANCYSSEQISTSDTEHDEPNPCPKENTRLPGVVRVLQAPVVQKLDSAIHRIYLYPVDNAIGFPNTYPLDSDLSRWIALSMF